MYFFYLQKMKGKGRNTNTNIRYDKNQTGPVSDCQRPRYSKTCLKQPLKNRQNKSLIDKWQRKEGQKYCRMLSWSILQYF